MDHWDEVRMFLAVARSGTVSAAAEELRVNHATIIRGVSRLEGRLSTRLFQKLTTGYRLTDAGADIVELAADMAAASSRIEARVLGRDQSVSGVLRFTLPISFATDLLMPTLKQFKRSYPEIALEILSSGALLNLSNREADVALRVIVGGSSPPETLFGKKLCEFRTGYYIARGLLKDGSARPAWLLGPNEVVPTGWELAGVTMASIPILFADMRSQLEAARLGMGASLFPCFVGDTDPLLERVPGSPLNLIGDVWLLTHADTRRTKRVRLLTEAVRKAVLDHAGRVAGQPE